MPSKQTVVCPDCGFGFPAESTTGEFTCPRRECGFAWTVDSTSMAEAYSAKKRDAEYALRVVAGDAPAQFVLQPGGRMVVGRDPECAIRLTNMRVSRFHAEVSLRGDVVWVKDLGSSAGSSVEGRALDGNGLELKLGERLLLAGSALVLESQFKPKTTHTQHVDDRQAIRNSFELDVLVGGKPAQKFSVSADVVSIGRQDDRDVVLKHSIISNKHAKLLRKGGAVFVLDTGSTTGTFVNGKAVIRKELRKGDRLQIGPFLFLFDGEWFSRQKDLANLNLVALGLTKGNGRELFLDDVSISIEPGEFAGVLGPSGAGKSTLLNALNGLRPASSGTVLLNGLDLYENFDRWRASIGFVPQEDIIHSELTVRDVVGYAARLRLPSDSTAAQIAASVSDAIKIVRMEHRAGTRVSRLSGGERKRASIAVELVANPTLLFLDEPTAALDPGTAGALMRTFREMADQGRTLICTTHIMENLDMFDKIVVLVRGKLAYFGPPRDCLRYFGVERFVDLYQTLESKKPEHWQSSFRDFSSFEQSSARGAKPFQNSAPEVTRENAKPKSGRWGELATLTSRYFKVYCSDWRTAASMLFQALIVGLMINWVCPGFSLAAFLTGISCLWFGCNHAAREIVRERAIFARERMVGQNVTCYFFSKVIVLSFAVLLQTALMSALLFGITGVEGSIARALVVLAASGIFGTLLGLAISALVTSEMAAVTLVPLVLIPQIILAGALVPVPHMRWSAKALSYACPTRWTNSAMDVSILNGRKITEELMADPDKRSGIQNAYPDYDLREKSEQASFIRKYFGDKVAVPAGNWPIAIVALFCLLAVAVAMIVLRTRASG